MWAVRMLHIVERVWSQFPVEGLSWSKGHQTTLQDPFKTVLVPATDSQYWLNQNAEDGQPQHHDIGTPPPTADEGDIENNDTASLVGQASWEGPRTGAESVVGEDVIPEGEEFTFPARPVEFQTVDRTISDARDVRVSPRGSDHSHERPENVVGNESDTDSMEFEVEGSMASGDEEEVVPSLEFVMPNVERGTVQLAFQRLDSVNLHEEFRIRASVMKTVPGFLQGRIDRRCTWRWRRYALDWSGSTMCARREDGSC